MNATRICSNHECDRAAVGRGMCLMHYKRWRKATPEVDRRRPGLRERFDALVDKGGNCWLWTGSTVSTGYGYISVDGKSKRAHRVSYEMNVGPIPDGMAIDHICHVPACVNPAHLRPVTNKQNAEHRTGAQSNSLSGVRGVSRDRWTGKWKASLQHNGQMIYLGLFQTIEEAADVVRAERNRIFTHNDHDRKNEPKEARE